MSILEGSWRRLLVLGVAGALTVLGGVVAAPAPSASAATIQAGTGDLYFTDNVAPYTTLYQRSPDGTTTRVTATDSLFSLALSPAGVLYTIGRSRAGDDHLSSVASDGTVTDLGAVSGISGNLGSAGFDENGYLWVGNGSTLFQVDVEGLTVVKTLAVQQLGDIAFANGKLYTMYASGRLARVDTETGESTVFGVSGTGGWPMSAMWSSKGHLYGSTLSSFYEIVGFESGPARAVKLFTLPATLLDGASDPGAPNPFLAAVDDPDLGRIVPGTRTTTNLFANDTAGGGALPTGSFASAIETDPDATGVVLEPDGTLSIPASAPFGVHSVTYRICSVSSADLCDTATATFTVANALAAVDHDYTADPVTASAGGTDGNLLTGATLNGAPVTDPAAVVATITDDGGATGANIAADGTLTVPAATAPGTYTLAYRLCDAADPTNCVTANVTFTVAAVAVAPAPLTPVPASVTPTGALAATGSTAAVPASLAGLLLLLGGGMALVARRRRRATNG